MENGKLQMTGQNIIREKSYEHALQIVRLSRELRKINEYELSSQLLRSGTSIGANVEEAQQAQSRRDFSSKMCIALKEAYENRYWLRLIRDSSEKEFQDMKLLLTRIEEIIRLLVAITKTSQTSQ